MFCEDAKSLRLWGAIALLALIALPACNDDAGTGEDPFSEDKAVVIGDVRGAAEENGGAGNNIQGAAQSNIQLSPQTINFEQVSIGEPNRKTLRVVNSGQGNLRIDSIELAEDNTDNAREFRPVGELTLEYLNALNDGKVIFIAPRERLELEFEWTPLNTTVDTGTVTFATNDPDATEATVNLVTPELGPAITVESEIRFPRVAAGAKDSRISFIQNTGKSPLQLKDIVLSPSSNTDFSLSFPDADAPEDESRDSETWAPSLEPGEKIDIRVSFAPDSDAPSDASIFVSSNDPANSQVEIKLVGNAGSPCIKLGPPAEQVEEPQGDETHRLDFEQSQISRDTIKTIQIINCSPTQDLEISEIFIPEGADSDGKFELSALPEGLADGPVTIEADKSTTFEVSYTPEAEELNEGRIVLRSNDEVNRELRIDVSGRGTNNVCPTALAEATIVGSSGRPSQQISTIPLKTIQFSGLNSTDSDGQVQRYEWSIVSAPTNSTSRFTPNNTSPEPRLFLDLAGEYVIELKAIDALGLESCEASRVVIQATPDEDIHVQLVWKTPDDNDETDTFGTDLDLHYLHPRGRWDVQPYDIFWRNPEADWGVQGNTTDDPSLDIDDTDGAGPENVNHDNPESGKSYTIGVYYYNDNGFGQSYATIRIYIEGTLKKELKDKFLEREDFFWEVGSIVWPSKQYLERDLVHSNGFPSIP